jgi:hypothetical protein
LCGHFYVRTEALVDKGDVSSNVAKIGSAALAILIKKIWSMLTTARELRWTVANQLLVNNNDMLTLERLGTVTNSTPHHYGSGNWLSDKDGPDDHLNYQEEMVMATASDHHGAIALIAYGFDLPNREAYCSIYVYAACPKFTSNGGNAKIVITDSKPLVTQDDLNKLFHSWDWSSLRRPSVDVFVEHDNKLRFDLNCSFGSPKDNDDIVEAKIVVSATNITPNSAGFASSGDA